MRVSKSHFSLQLALLMWVLALIVTGCFKEYKETNTTEDDVLSDTTEVAEDTDTAEVSTCSETCSATESCCSEVCIDTSKDVENCGACGNTCGDGESCYESQCDACTACTENCGGVEERGTCFNTDQCAAGLVCFAGLCWPPCCGGPGSCGNSLKKCYQGVNGSGEVVAAACINTTPCDPLNPECTEPLGCFFTIPDGDTQPQLLCAPSAQNLKEGTPCSASNACEPGLMCFRPGSATQETCHRICDHTLPPADNGCSPTQNCPKTVTFSSSGRTFEFGVCIDAG